MDYGVSFWKSLQGPGNDWPLAFCDWRTVNRKCDTISADVVFHNRFTENERLYYSPKHKWYYFQDLGDDEVVVFRQTDSEVENGGGKFTSLSPVAYHLHSHNVCNHSWLIIFLLRCSARKFQQLEGR